MSDNRARIERVWKITHEWATAFDGTPHEAYLPDAPLVKLALALDALLQNSPKFDVAAIWGDQVSEDEVISASSSGEFIREMERGRVAELSINTIAELPEFDLDLHLIVRARPEDRVDVEIIWWADQAFPDDIEWQPRFEAMLDYFIRLQQLFGADKLYIGPEALDRPGQGKSQWVAV